MHVPRRTRPSGAGVPPPRVESFVLIVDIRARVIFVRTGEFRRWIRCEEGGLGFILLCFGFGLVVVVSGYFSFFFF